MKSTRRSRGCHHAGLVPAFGVVLSVALSVTLGLALGCAREPATRDLDRAVAMATTRPGLILVEALLVTADDGGAGGARLLIDRALAAAGAVPKLIDRQGLEGRIELLDGDGATLWSMGYQPLAQPDPVASLRLRAPLLETARSVRLTEAGGKRVAEAPIEK